MKRCVLFRVLNRFELIVPKQIFHSVDNCIPLDEFSAYILKHYSVTKKVVLNPPFEWIARFALLVRRDLTLKSTMHALTNCLNSVSMLSQSFECERARKIKVTM